jgi:hypothetical protein
MVLHTRESPHQLMVLKLQLPVGNPQGILIQEEQAHEQDVEVTSTDGHHVGYHTIIRYGPAS